MCVRTCVCAHECVCMNMYTGIYTPVGLEDRFEEYPKLKELIRLKDEQIAKYASPPMYVHIHTSTQYNFYRKNHPHNMYTCISEI